MSNIDYKAEVLKMMIDHLNKHETMTYQERVRQMAEKMAEAAHNQERDAKSWSEWRNRYPATASEYIDKITQLAQLAVQMQADAILDFNNGKDKGAYQCLISNGYMPQTIEP